ncbi:MAG: hypothetical protein ACRDF4_11950, partial [Rhabdochlamydiaceae bacterium]
YWLSKGAILSERAERIVKGVAPDVIRDLQAKRNAKRVKLAAIRRKKAAPKTPVAEESIKKKRAPAAKKTKTKDES